MPTSKTFLPDVNVWVALASDEHVHNQAAMRWFYSVQEEAIAFCRVTQMGLLRLLTNRKVMLEDVMNQNQAWNTYTQLYQDPRATFLNEPPGIETAWQTLTREPNSPIHSWTDAYLIAFAKVRGATLVTFDKSLAQSSETPILLLS